MWNFLGGAIGALGSIYGANQNAAAQNQANVFNYDIAQENMAQQQQFAQQSAGWRLSDLVSTAKNVGINPLAALGVQGTTYQNQVGNWQAASPGAGYSQAGQSLGRAIAAIQSPEDRAQTALNLEHSQLQNDYLRSQIQHLNSPSLAAGVPSVDHSPGTVPGDPGVVWGRASDVQETDVAGGGGTAVIPPKEISQLGFFHPASLSWYARNGLLPAFGANVPDTQKGKYYNPFTMTYSQDAPVMDRAWEGFKYYYNKYNDFFGRAW